MTAQDTAQRAADDTVVIGIVADPVAEPAEVARQLSVDLPGLLSELLDGRAWRVEVCRERLPPSDRGHTEMMDFATERMRERGWDHAVCVTDLPLSSGRQVIAADANNSRGVVVVSLPAFGGVALRRRVRAVVAQLIAGIRLGTLSQGDAKQYRRRRLTTAGNQFRRVIPEQDGVDVRILASRGWLRLLVGMVRDNRPWRLVFGLRGALVGAFAFSAFYLINSTVWQLATTMNVFQLLVAVFGSVAVMVAWLIAYHHLWERVAHQPPSERRQAVLFNASTVLTLAVGVACGYALLYVVNLTAAALVVTAEVFGRYVGSDPGVGDYAAVVLLVTATGTVAGAIGSGFDGEDSVRAAAYSYRERERRAALRSSRRRHEQQQRETGGHDAESVNQH